MKKKMVTAILIGILIIMGVVVTLYSSRDRVNEGIKMENIDKKVEDYTMDEFNSLTGEEQIKFQSSFETPDAFEQWLNEVNPDQDSREPSEDEIPWKNGGKKPEEYTWEEFNELSAGLQIKFQSAFENEDGFDEWLKKNEPARE